MNIGSFSKHMKSLILLSFIFISSIIYSQDMIGCSYYKIKYELSKKYEFTTGYSKEKIKYLKFYTPCEVITYYFDESNICINIKIIKKDDTFACSIKK
jgi:hypothetical protein